MLNLDEKQLKNINSRSNLKKLLEHVMSNNVEKVTKMCTKGLDPNFHCQDSGGESTQVFLFSTLSKLFLIETILIKLYIILYDSDHSNKITAINVIIIFLPPTIKSRYCVTMGILTNKKGMSYGVC